jgi:hypothetical protein
VVDYLVNLDLLSEADNDGGGGAGGWLLRC